ncbi:MAG: hypothetical protein H8E98_01245 [Bacteroidetes bacterium]|nr:hypothetical protein [Bacteroidota bacterium]MBL7013575.1 hypothetical protein [Candidatus Neomarinimicrobiota bacterium]
MFEFPWQVEQEPSAFPPHEPDNDLSLKITPKDKPNTASPITIKPSNNSIYKFTAIPVFSSSIKIGVYFQIALLA